MALGFNDGVQQRVPDRAMQKRATPRVLLSFFGDGYEQRVPLGINNAEEEYTVTFRTRAKVDIDNIAAFFNRMKGTEYFNFNVPDTNSGGEKGMTVYCPDYSLSYDYGEFYSISAIFKRVYGTANKTIGIPLYTLTINTKVASLGGSAKPSVPNNTVLYTRYTPTTLIYSYKASPANSIVTITRNIPSVFTNTLGTTGSLILTGQVPDAAVPQPIPVSTVSLIATRNAPSLLNTGVPSIPVGSIIITRNLPSLRDSGRPSPGSKDFRLTRTVPTMYPIYDGSSRLGSPNALPLSLLAVITAFESGDKFRQDGVPSPADSCTVVFGNFGSVTLTRLAGFENTTITIPMYFSNSNGGTYDTKNIYYNLVMTP